MKTYLVGLSCAVFLLAAGCGPATTTLVSGTYTPDTVANPQGLSSAVIDADALSITMTFSASNEERSMTDVTESFEYSCDNGDAMTTLRIDGDPVQADDAAYSDLHVVVLCTEGNIRIGWSEDDNMALSKS